MKQIDQVKIGAFIRENRMEKGLTQEQLADQVGVSQKSISRWETGSTMPDYSLLPKICEVLEVNVAELFGAEHISGDSVSKNQVMTMTQNMIALVHDKNRFYKTIGAVVTAILMLVCAVGFYNLECDVSADSTVGLEYVIGISEESEVDVLESQIIDKELFVLYEINGKPYKCGLACLKKGIFGKYRFIESIEPSWRWINARDITVGKKDYCTVFCARDLPIDEYGVYGYKTDPETGDQKTFLISKQKYAGSPFLNIIEVKDGDVKIREDLTRYYRNGVKMTDDELYDILGNPSVEGEPSGVAHSGEGNYVYVVEAFIILIGGLLIYIFLKDRK